MYTTYLKGKIHGFDRQASCEQVFSHPSIQHTTAGASYYDDAAVLRSTDHQLDVCVAAKRAYARADRLCEELRTRGVDPESARPQSQCGESSMDRRRRRTDDLSQQECVRGCASSSVRRDDQGDMRYVAGHAEIEAH